MSSDLLDYNENSAFGINIMNNLKDDKYMQNLETVQSLEPGAYTLENFYPKDCGQKSARSIQTSQVGINFSGGAGSIGKDGCLVDDNSFVRLNELTNLNTIHQLDERLTLTTPYIRGFYDVDSESKLISSDGTKQHRTCNVENLETGGCKYKTNYAKYGLLQSM